MFKFSRFFKDKRRPESWESDEVVEGKLYRYVDTGVGLPLIEIREHDLPKLEGYEFFEPYWIVAQEPAYYAIYDHEERLIFSPMGLAKDYSLERLVREAGFRTVDEFRKQYENANSDTSLTDFDIWVRLGLPAKVYIPSLKRKADASN